MQQMATPPAFLVVGGGPVGFAVALLLAKDGHRCTVYEGRSHIVHVPEESFPIGVNARGLHTLGLISPSLEAACRSTGKIVDAWEIFGGPQKVAEQKSGVVCGTSRGKVNLLLAEAAASSALISIVYSHRLRDVRIAKRELVFEVRGEDGQKREVVVAVGAGASVVAAAGVNSAARTAMDAQEPGFLSRVTPWRNEFRVLFAAPGAAAPLLDERVHYIFSGAYAATVDNGGQQQWTLVMGARDGAPDEERALLLSENASEANVAALRAMLRRLAPRVEPLLPDDELRRFFARRTFRGAVVEVNRANAGEFLLLVGDAAHSVLPPTGEGINSGLEDAVVLAECVRAGGGAPFADYNARRTPDGLASRCSRLARSALQA